MSRGLPLRPCAGSNGGASTASGCQLRLVTVVNACRGLRCPRWVAQSDTQLCDSGNASNSTSNRSGNESRRSEDVRSRFQDVPANFVAGRKVMQVMVCWKQKGLII